ncbi:ferritin-like domain-containing protein [Rhodoplanes roseus]|uniref:Uncharacterized protein n=1 Tax=Rhodoplanes roseus TaxID=29409 RepID=A0A327KZZ1_9BRAD|nr:DUF892 family protein [Rhodoplanes roseus]RAI43791.1 hypothetical protein CH341_12440 [Rhodoplanes roseus]
MIQSPEELLSHQLFSIRDAESQASKAIERYLEHIETDDLRELLALRLAQGKTIVQNVEKGMKQIAVKPRSKQNAAARGLIEQTEALLGEVESIDMKEAAVIAGVQELEHYCIAVWGTVRALAGEVGEDDLAGAMQRAVEEGYALDEQLSAIAEGEINPSAMAEESEDDEEFGEEDTAEGADGDEAAGTESGRTKNKGKSAATSGKDSDLKQREYRGADGEIHHHTRKAMERSGGK